MVTANFSVIWQSSCSLSIFRRHGTNCWW